MEMMVDDQGCALEAWFRLDSIQGIGPATAGKLLEHFESPSNIFLASGVELETAGASSELVERLLSSAVPDISEVLEWLDQSEQHSIVTRRCPLYPRLLAECSSAPLMLYCMGDASLLNAPQIAVVGTRNPSISGRETAMSLTADLARQGLCITSGLALGIDGIAHRTALENNRKTIAVAGTGLDRIYPAINRNLAHKIVEHGLIVSEFPLNTRVKGSNFPKRNRIISGLSLGVVVIEAALKSGSLITAHYALEQGREIFALPGSINNPMARGCHSLIKQGAHLTESVEDILQQLGWLYQAQTHLNAQDHERQGHAPEPLSHDLSQILHWIDFAPTSIDLLVERCKKPVAELSAKLITLELDGWVASASGGYQRLK